MQYGLAPMEGVTDFATRLWFHQTSQPNFQWTPFLRATASYPPRTRWLDDFCPEILISPPHTPYPLTVQLMASDPDDFCRTAEVLLDHVSFVDLNCGCPSPNPVGGGAGSSLLRNPDDWRRFLETILRRLGPRRLAIKMRTGFHDATEFPGLYAAIADLPLAQVTIHGRTRPDRYSGEARWDLMAQATTASQIPVIGSGDVVDRESALLRRQWVPQIQRTIIGRGALRNPWIFEELRTNQVVEIPRSVIIHSLAVFAFLQHLQRSNFNALRDFLASEAMKNTAGLQVESWEALNRQFALICRMSANPFDLSLKDATLGRVKMLWNYTRSSLPSPFFAPTLMRAKSVGELLQGIDRIADAANLASLPIQANPAYHWMYGGKSKESVESST